MPHDYERDHRANQQKYERAVGRIYRDTAKRAAALPLPDSLPEGALFSFATASPAVKRLARRLFRQMARQVELVVVNGIRSEWTLANNKCDELARRVFGDPARRLSPAEQRRYFSTNATARDAFLARKVNGMDLSDRVWRYTDQYRSEIELGLDIGIRTGLPADEIGRELQQYLRYPDRLFRRVRDIHGNLQLSKAAAAFHPGRGVYRSSYKSARRLAGTETNIAYRTADYERWQQMDFVVGIEIHLSNNHTVKNAKGERVPLEDICDELAGRYPKDFKFTGWHPNCRCYATSILKTPEEMSRDRQRIMRGEAPLPDSVNTVKGVPKAFNDWIENNKERAKGWSSMPYFVRENPQYVRGFEVDTYSPAERKFTRATTTSTAMKESLGIFLQARYPDIPNTEKAAIFHFTRGDISAYRQLNNQLRRGNLSEFNQAFSQLLSRGLSRIEPVEQTVYRTVRLNKTNLTAFIENAQKGKTSTFAGFTSTTTDRSVAEKRKESLAPIKKNETDVLLVINGKSGRPIEDLSQFGGRFEGLINQHEILFDKGCKFRFDKVIIKSSKMPVFYLTEI